MQNRYGDNNFVSGGIGRSAPLFYVKFLVRFGGSAAQTAWVTSLGATVRLLVGELSVCVNDSLLMI